MGHHTSPNKVGRPKERKSFRGSTPKQKTVPKCILDTKMPKKTPCIPNFPQEIPSSIVSFNDNFLNDADTQIHFWQIWQREMYQLFRLKLMERHH